VDAGRNCLLAEPRPAEMAKALVRLVDDPELRERLGRQGAADQSVRTWTRTASQFEQNLLRLCFARLAGREEQAGRSEATAREEAAAEGADERPLAAGRVRS
jgi:hypothetical protein